MKKTRIDITPPPPPPRFFQNLMKLTLKSITPTNSEHDVK